MPRPSSACPRRRRSDTSAARAATHDRGGPEIEPAEDHRPEQERSDRGEAEGRPDVQRRCAGVRAARPPSPASAAAPHIHMSVSNVRRKPADTCWFLPGSASPGSANIGSAPGGYSTVEVAVRNLSVRDRVSVALIDGRVDHLLVLVEADVEQRPRDDEERDRRERRGDHGTLRCRARAARGHVPEQSERDEGEEPRDVEVEPVRQHELEADQERTGQRGKLQRRLRCAARMPRRLHRATSSPSSTHWTTWRSGIPRAWYCAQSQSENGDSRVICVFSVRS